MIAYASGDSFVQQRPHLRTLSVVLSLLSIGAGFAVAKEPSNRARELVQASLAAESKGLEQERRTLLEKAISEEPDEPSVRWRLGQILDGREWKSVDSVASEWSRSKALIMYYRLRDGSQPTLASQLELAAFCDAKGLTNEAIAHRMAVLELEPNHEYTRMKLGYTLFEGRWYLRSELEKEWLRARRITKALQTESDDLGRIARRLQRKTMSVQDATDEIVKRASVDVIPAWELCLSSAHGQGAMAVVDALATMPQPESTLALARHACWVDDPIVREAAIQALCDRDEYAYVPAMLSELQGPWTPSTPMVLSEGNRLVFRYMASSESRDKKSVQVFDNAYFLEGNIASASQLANQANTFASLSSEYARSQINASIEQRNKRVIHALQQITGESTITSPQAWWSWWDDRTEVYSSGEKPWEASFGFHNSTVSGAPIMIPPTSFVSSPRPSKPRETKDCLAAGTPILTNRGPLAIESLRIGDLVWSKNLDTGEVRLQPILRTTVRQPSHLIRIRLIDSTNQETILRASGGHPFFVSGKGWIRARDLTSGMTLHGLESVCWVQSAEREEEMNETYNLVVHEFHTYFAGPTATLSHDNSIVTPAVTTVPGFEVAAR
ncbi:MAG: HINT domain-containing protein [Pirellula sp.]|jgi:hypothetical protein|nr:HINT domain-containing protein [Pirellula sp.]